MSIQETSLAAIADAIREKEGSTCPIPAKTFAERILAIKTGSDFAVPLVVTVDVAGAEVTAVNGETTLTAITGENGVAVFQLDAPGEWFIEAIFDGRTIGPKTVQVVDRYDAALAFQESRLPEGYTEVAYIQSDGTQYLTCGGTPATTLKVVMDVEPMTGTTAGDFFGESYYLLYSSTVGYRTYYCGMRLATTGILVSAYINAYTTVVSSNIEPRRMILCLDLPNKSALVDDETKSISVNLDYKTGMALLARAAYSKVTGKTTYTGLLSAKLYSYKLYTSDTLIRDLVPCIDPSGAVGLYDLIDGQFYGNAGTGAFTAGPAV